MESQRFERRIVIIVRVRVNVYGFHDSWRENCGMSSLIVKITKETEKRKNKRYFYELKHHSLSMDKKRKN